MDTRRTRELFSLTVDVVMVALIIANLTLIIIDWGFASTVVQNQLQYYAPAVHQWYDQTIHQ
ncbi:MAG TPA: hypothetical protein VJ884_10300, partial [Salinibacter sp.]|nr:hypothetical protein [Salinibacter sp.]